LIYSQKHYDWDDEKLVAFLQEFQRNGEEFETRQSCAASFTCPFFVPAELHTCGETPSAVWICAWTVHGKPKFNETVKSKAGEEQSQEHALHFL
jgi:hypothetical protein